MRFGFVEFIDDNEVADALFDAAIRWGKERGMTTVTGPMGFSDMDHEGMLVEGFDRLGTMATIYNYPYYPKHMERMGFEKDVDWVEYLIKIPDGIPEKHQRIADIVQRKYGLKILRFKSRKKSRTNTAMPSSTSSTRPTTAYTATLRSPRARSTTTSTFTSAYSASTTFR